MSTAALGAKGEDRGVTLIELVIGMALMGFLAALIIPVVWYGRFGANPMPTAQATAIAQSTLETAMTASYAQPFPNCNCTISCNPPLSSQNDYGVAVACSASVLSGTKAAEYLTVRVTGPSGADITLGAWRTRYIFSSAAAPGNGNGNGKGKGNGKGNG